MRLDESVPEVVCNKEEYGILEFLSNFENDDTMWEYCNMRLGFNLAERLNELSSSGTMKIRLEEESNIDER